MSTDLPSSQLSIIVDLISKPFDYKALYKRLSSEPPASSEHHYWHFAGLRAYAIAFQSTDDQRLIDGIIDKLKTIQNQPSSLPPFWISHKKTVQATPSNEVINKNAKLAKISTNAKFHIAYTAGALLQLDKYAYDLDTGINDVWGLTFYHDRIDMDYGPVDKRMRKVFKADMMDRCSVVMTHDNGFSLFINLSGNPIEYKTANADGERRQTRFPATRITSFSLFRSFIASIGCFIYSYCIARGSTFLHYRSSGLLSDQGRQTRRISTTLKIVLYTIHRILSTQPHQRLLRCDPERFVDTSSGTFASARHGQ